MTNVERPVVISGAVAGDAHVVATRLITLQVRKAGCDVVRLGACTSVAGSVEYVAAHLDAVALINYLVDGHAVDNPTRLRVANDAGRASCAAAVCKNLYGRFEADDKVAMAAVRDFGADYVLGDMSAQPTLVAARRRRQPEEASR